MTFPFTRSPYLVRRIEEWGETLIDLTSKGPIGLSAFCVTPYILLGGYAVGWVMPQYPPTIVYSWDVAGTFFELDQLRAKRLADGWIVKGEVHTIFIKRGPLAGLKHRQIYMRTEALAVVKPRPEHATAETHRAMAETQKSAKRHGDVPNRFFGWRGVTNEA